jgi:hypothetical protein
MSHPPLFYLLQDPSFGDRGANVHPPLSLDSDQLLTPCCLILPKDTPRLMLHVYIVDITTLATLSDTIGDGISKKIYSGTLTSAIEM